MPIDVLGELARALTGGRARRGEPPSRERLRELGRAVAAGQYRVDADRVAEALLRTQGRSGRRG